jgi:hypothetical protein
MAQGPVAGLDELDAIAAPAGDAVLAGYHLLHSVRGDLLMKLGRFSEAREEIEHAIAMTQNLREQELLTERLKPMEKATSSTLYPKSQTTGTQSSTLRPQNCTRDQHLRSKPPVRCSPVKCARHCL